MSAFELRLPGILCTEEGDAYLNLLKRYLEYVRDLSFGDDSKIETTHSEVAIGLSLKLQETIALGRLIFAGFFFGGGSHSDNFASWSVLFPKSVEDLPKNGPLDDVVAGLVLANLREGPKIFLTDRHPSSKGRTSNSPAVPIRFGMQIRMRHLGTSAYLRSLKRIFSHAGSSNQQMVVAGTQIAEDTVWIVKVQHGSEARLESRPVRRDAIVRLEHRSTRMNLHSHAAPAPATPGQFEVTAFGKNGEGDPNDDWVVEPEGGDIWLSDHPIRLIHNNTRRNLHSHPVSNSPSDSNFQEVTGFGGRDENDLWAAIVVGEPVEKTTSVVKGAPDLVPEGGAPSLGFMDVSRSQEPEFRFSKTATLVLQHAALLAERAKRPGITSSCILFAFAEQASEQSDTSKFVLDVFFRGRDLPSEMHEFVSDRFPSDAEPFRDELPLFGRMSPNVHSMLIRASAIALRVSHTSVEIHQRHLLGALLIRADNEDVPHVWRRLEGMGCNLSNLRKEFRGFLSSSPSGDDLKEWDTILGIEPSIVQADPRDKEFKQGTAGYSVEYCGVGGTAPILDNLGVQVMADRLAELIALRETRLPLAIGLFGDWGSGKSHFMNLIDRRIKALASDSRSRPNGTPAIWCRGDRSNLFQCLALSRYESLGKLGFSYF